MTATTTTTKLSSIIISTVRRRPLLFNGISGGILCAISDGIAQHYEVDWKQQQQVHNKNKNIDHDDDDDDAYVQISTQQQNLNHKKNKDGDLKDKQRYLAPSPSTKTIIKGNNNADNNSHHNSMEDNQNETTVNDFDWTRVGAAGIIGIFFGGCVYPMAYAKLDALWVGTAFASVLKKSITEIVTVGIFVNSVSMTSRGLCRGDKNPDIVLQHVTDELPTVTRNDFCVWLPYNIMAFSIIPTFIRPFSTVMMEATWQAYISFRSHDFEQQLPTAI